MSKLIAVRLPDELVEPLGKKVLKSGKSQSEIVIKALSEYLKTDAKPQLPGRPKVGG